MEQLGVEGIRWRAWDLTKLPIQPPETLPDEIPAGKGQPHPSHFRGKGSTPDQPKGKGKGKEAQENQMRHPEALPLEESRWFHPCQPQEKSTRHQGCISRDGGRSSTYQEGVDPCRSRDWKSHNGVFCVEEMR